jgi:hypothetical protein
MPNPGTYICSPGLSFYYPDVSANQQQVAVTADADSASIGDATNQIMVLANAPATSGGTAITPSGYGAVKPNWSPDGTTIAFQGTGSTVWTVPAGGGTPVKILDDATSPAWTPYAAGATGGGGGGGSGGSGSGSGGGGGGAPSNVFTLGSTRQSGTGGTAILIASVPGPGTLDASGKAVLSKPRPVNVVRTHVKVTHAGTVPIVLKPNAAATKQLKKKGSLKVTVTITFSPTGGTPSSTTRTVTLKTKKGRKH